MLVVAIFAAYMFNTRDMWEYPEYLLQSLATTLSTLIGLIATVWGIAPRSQDEPAAPELPEGENPEQ